MKKTVAFIVCALAVCSLASTGFAKEMKGEAKFKEYCSSCHPDGGNIVNPQKTLKKQALAANGVKSVKDIVAKIRKPGPGMTAYDAKTLPDKEAKEIAEYVLKTFK